MKKAGISGTSILVIIAGCILFSLPARAGWTQPVLLSELNNYAVSKAAFDPAVTADGSLIYFLKPSAQQDYVLYEAKLDEATGLYSQQRFVSELVTPTTGVYSPWVSANGLRLYYAQDVFLNGQWERVVKFADRASVNQTWVYRRTLMELHIDTVDYQMAFTADELNVFWISQQVGAPSGTVYQASRPSVSSPFQNIKPVQEFSDRIINDMCLSSDGLTIYFEQAENDAGLVRLWKAVRSALTEPFGQFEPIDDINQWSSITNNIRSSVTRNPWVSPDQRTLWFFQRQAEITDLSTNRGIFISRWEDEPYVKAVKALMEARQLKQESLQTIDLAIEKEKEALDILLEMLKAELPEGLTKKDISKSRLAILHAICKQIAAECDLKKSLKELEQGIAILDPAALNPQ